MDTRAYASAVAEEVSAALAQIPPESGEELTARILAARAVFTAGAGRSGLAARAFAMRLMHLGLRAYVCGETATPALQAGDLLIAVTGSGRTPGLVAMAEKARSLGGSAAVLTTRPESPAARLADLVIPVPAPTPKAAGGGFPSVQPMGSLFEQTCFLFLDAVVLRLMEKRGETSETMFARHANLE